MPNPSSRHHLEGKTHDKHGNHPAKGDIHPCFPLWQHLVPIQDHNQIDFLLLNNLDSLVKGQVIHEFGSL
jgi:hypothetical protein